MAVKFNDRHGYTIEFSDKVKAELEAFVSEHEEEWDKIRNLALMDIPENDLERCYQDLWIQIDRCAKKGSWVVHPMADDPDSLIFYYLEVKLSTTVDGDHLYTLTFQI